MEGAAALRISQTFPSRKIANADQAILQKTSPLAIWTRRVQCRTTLVYSYIKWPWLGICFKQTSYEDNISSEWDAAVLATREFLLQRWECYTRAWHAIIQLKDQYMKTWLVTFSQKQFLDWRCPDLLQLFCARYGKRDNPISAAANSYRQVHIVNSTICRPSWHLELQNPHIRWKTVWKILCEFSKEASELEYSLRLFLLGKLTTPASWASADLEKWPNNRSKICLLCSTEPESRVRLLEGCRRVHVILVRAIGGYGDGFMRAFADKDIMDPDDMGMLYGRASAIHHLFKFIRS